MQNEWILYLPPVERVQYSWSISRLKLSENKVYAVPCPTKVKELFKALYSVEIQKDVTEEHIDLFLENNEITDEVNDYQTNEIDDLIKIIKTTYLRNDNRQKEGKKLADKDSFFFNKAEKFLYTEISNEEYNEAFNNWLEKIKEVAEYFRSRGITVCE